MSEPNPPDSTPDPAPAAKFAKGDVAELESSWPYPTVSHLLVVDVDDRGWVSGVAVPQPTGYIDPDSLTKAD